MAISMILLLSVVVFVSPLALANGDHSSKCENEKYNFLIVGTQEESAYEDSFLNNFQEFASVFNDQLRPMDQSDFNTYVLSVKKNAVKESNLSAYESLYTSIVNDA